MQGLWEKRGGAAYPVSEEAWRFLGRIGNHTRFVADTRDPTRRSGEQHRFWFSLAHTLFDNQETHRDFDQFRARLLVYLGYYEELTTREGDRIAVPRSLKFGRMPADEFGVLVDATLDFAVEMGWDRDELLAQTREVAA